MNPFIYQFTCSNNPSSSSTANLTVLNESSSFNDALNENIHPLVTSNILESSKKECSDLSKKEKVNLLKYFCSKKNSN